MAEILNRKEQCARKTHHCELCNGEIYPGESYVQEQATPTISNAKATVAVAEATENTNSHEEEESNMETKDITLEQLRAENPNLHDQIMQAGAAQERERIADIDALTPTGYEEMAEEAKKNGTSAMDYHKQIVKAQKEKGKDFLAARKTETAPAAQVAGGSHEENDGKTAKQELEENAKEMAAFAKSMYPAGADGGMY